MPSSIPPQLPHRRGSFQHTSNVAQLHSGSTSTLDSFHTSASTSTSPTHQDPYAHRSLYNQTRLPRPPTTGPSSQPHPPRQHSSNRSMPADLSQFFGNMKRSLSLNLNTSKKSDPQHSPSYVGITPEEDAARFHRQTPPQPLLPPPTFQQIASGLAVMSSRPQPQQSRSALAPPPKRSSLKRTTTTSNDGHDSVIAGLPSSSKFAFSSPSLALTKSSSRVSNVHSHTPSTSASSTTSSFTNSTTSSSAFARLPFARKHKLSLSISTITGRRGSGTSSLTDSGVSWGAGDDGSSSGHSSTRKAVRFSESQERSLAPSSNKPLSNLGSRKEVNLTSSSQDSFVPSKHAAGPHHPNTFVGRTARFFSNR